MDRRLREALASYAKGDSGTPVETVMGRLRKRERKPQTGS